MLLNSKRKDVLSCSLCNKGYNNLNQKPYCLIPCGHTYCLECIQKLNENESSVEENKENYLSYAADASDDDADVLAVTAGKKRSSSKKKKCPTCNIGYNQSIPDYDLIDKLNGTYHSSKSSNNIDDTPENNRLELTDDVIKMVMSDEKSERFKGSQIIRKLLSREDQPPINEVITAGLVPLFTKFITKMNNDNTNNANNNTNTNSHFQDSFDNTLIFESLWILTNVASGNTSQTQTVIDAGVVPIAIKLIESPDANISEQAIWLLGNVAGDSPKTRDLVLDAGILDPLLAVLMNPNSGLTLLKNSVWCISNLCRGKAPAVNLRRIQPCLKILSDFLYHKDPDIVADVCWSLSYLTDGANDRIQSVLDKINLKALVDLLDHDSVNVLQSALRTIGNIVTGTDVQTQLIVDLNVMPKLLTLLGAPKRSIRKETCWMLSNVTAGTQAQIQAVIEANIFPKVLYLMLNDEPDVCKEAVWVISNATSGGSQAQIKYLVHVNVLQAIAEKLRTKTLTNLLLEALENILTMGDEEDLKDDNVNPYSVIFNDCCGADLLNDLISSSSSNEVISKCNDILEVFFQNENLNDDETSEDNEFVIF